MSIIINIPVNELNEVCAKKDKKFTTSTHFNLTNRDCVHEVFRYQKFQDDFADNIICINNGKDIIGSFKPSYEEFLRSIIKALNVKLPRGYSDDEELTNKLMERLKLLKSIPDEAWLYNEFPVLYKNLQNGRKYIKEVVEEKKNPIYQEVSKEDEHYYYACGMKKGFNNYIPQQVKVYERFINQRKEYRDLINTKNYNDFIVNNYDTDKLAMYLAHKYLTVCEDLSGKRKTLNRYSKLIEKYINSDYDKTVIIRVDKQLINYDNIKERYNALNKRIEKLDGEVNWVLIPEGKRLHHVSAAVDPRVHYMSEEELNALKTAGKEKEEFYKKNAPLLKAYGTLKYDGYIAYIYPNGEVLLDTEYDERDPRTAIGNAIYHMKAIYFDMVSRLDKTVLQNHPAVDRLYHSGAWQKRAEKIINTPGSKNDQENAKQLVKRITEDNEKNL